MKKRMPEERNKKVYYIFTAIFGACFIIIAIRLFILQVVKHDDYYAKALVQQTWEVSIDPVRGAIKDVNGVDLAVSNTAYRVVVAPSGIESKEDSEKIAQFLSDTLNLDYETVFEYTQKNKQYQIVASKIEAETADMVRRFIQENKYSSVLWLEEVTKRYYPHNNLLSTVIGFVGTDNKGLEGVEYYYDSLLGGTPGKSVAIRNAHGVSVPYQSETVQEAVDGYDLYLTTDIQLQYVLEKYISEAREQHNVQSRVAGVVMNVKTGAVLAMASKPDFDLNEPFVVTDELTLKKLTEEYASNSEEYQKAYSEALIESRKNKIVSEIYDPGSTFKIFTGAMVLEEGLVKSDFSETFNCGGALAVANLTYHCAAHKNHGMQTFAEAMANSCNLVFIQFGQKVGIHRFYDYVNMFGFLDKTDVGLPGEATGLFFKRAEMSEFNLYSASFGQTFQVTPMQLIAGVSAVANGGTYMQPYIIDRIVDQDGNIISKTEPTVKDEILSSHTCDALKEAMEYTVVKGKTGALAGYRICGKTGTSEKASDGTYETGKIIASFVCFAPADDPEIAVLVVVDEPNSKVQYGSYIASPLGRDIMQACLEYYNIEPNYEVGESDAKISVRNEIGKSVDDAAAELSDSGLAIQIIGDGSLVQDQHPKSGSLYSGNVVYLYTDSDSDVEKSTRVPDLIGKTAAECNLLLQHVGLNFHIVGGNLNYPTTIAIGQSVEVNKSVRKGTLVTVTFEDK